MKSSSASVSHNGPGSPERALCAAIVVQAIEDLLAPVTQDFTVGQCRREAISFLRNDLWESFMCDGVGLNEVACLELLKPVLDAAEVLVALEDRLMDTFRPHVLAVYERERRSAKSSYQIPLTFDVLWRSGRVLVRTHKNFKARGWDSDPAFTDAVRAAESEILGIRRFVETEKRLREAIARGPKDRSALMLERETVGLEEGCDG